jgi:hypothetical protein
MSVNDPLAGPATKVFLLHWNGSGPVGCQVERFDTVQAAEGWTFEALPGDRTAHVVSCAGDMSDRLLFPNKKLVEIFNAITDNILVIKSFRTLDDGRDRVYQELVRRYGDAPITQLPAPPAKSGVTTVSESEVTTPCFLVFVGEDMIRVRSFTSVADAQAVQKDGVDLITKQEDLSDYTIAQLVGIHNKVATKKTQVTDFKKKADGVAATWERMQSLPYSTPKAPKATGEKKAPKAAGEKTTKTSRGEGVIGTLISLLREGEPKTSEELFQGLLLKFPERGDGMKTTVNVQLSGLSRSGKLEITKGKNEAGKTTYCAAPPPGTGETETEAAVNTAVDEATAENSMEDAA